jgi:hypothetical protein
VMATGKSGRGFDILRGRKEFCLLLFASGYQTIMGL